MRYSTKITLLLVAVSVLPVGASGLVSSTLSSKTLTAETLRLQRELVRQVAAQVETWTASVLRDLGRASSYLPFERMAGEELKALLRVPYRQLGYATAVVLVDSAGKQVVPAAYLAADGQVPADAKLPADLRGRPRLVAADVERLVRQIPLSRTLKQQAGCSEAYTARKGSMRICCAVALDDAGTGKRLLAAEVTLDRLDRLLQTARRFGGRLYITDAVSRVIVGSGSLASGQRLQHLARLHGGGAPVERYRNEQGRKVFGTMARIAQLGWSLRLEQPVDKALGPARRLLIYTGLWTALCLVLALVGGLVLGRGVTRPVRRLAVAARSMQDGDLGQQVPVRTNDELGELGGAFNEMAAAVQHSMRVIENQRDELKRWNLELQQRVEERTREVEEALEQVIRSQKMGALGELSAGVAHELNNPLASIVLAAQLAQTKMAKGDANRENLDTVIEQAQRMHEIVQRLLRFAETPEGVEHRPLKVEPLCRGALQLAHSALEEASIETAVSLPRELVRIQGDPEQLQQAFLHLIYNAVRAMPDGGKLSIEGQVVKEAVRICFRDTGRGIEADKLDRIFEPFFAVEKPRTRGAGLGLSVVDRIVREHEGRITVRSTVGKGTEFNLYFPGLRKQLHL